MARYVLRRLVLAIPLLIGISLVVFLMVHLAPGDAAEFALGQRANEEDLQRLRHYLGLDLPWYQQYARLVGDWLRLDLGTSIIQKRPVIDLITQRLPRTLELVGLSILLSLLIAIPIGVISALKRYSLLDNIVTVFSFLGISVPTFWLGIIFVLVFAVKLGWFPTSGTQTVGQPFSIADHVKHLVLPLTVLTLVRTAGWSRYLRSSMLEVLGQDYIRTARAKGLAERRVIIAHAVRNALIPVITIMAIQIPQIFTGAVVTEQIFRVPGIGSLLITSINGHDTPVIMGIVFTFGALVVFFTLVADVLYGVLDPRIKYS